MTNRLAIHRACLVLALFAASSHAALAQSASAIVANSQPEPQLERLDAQSTSVRIRIDGEQKQSWSLDASMKPDVFSVEVAPGQLREVCYVSGDLSLCRTVALNEQADFLIVRGGVEYPQRIIGRPPAAVFNAAYQAEHQGMTRVLIPEVYELVNIAIALTPMAQEDESLVVKTTPYYTAVMAHFGEHADHPLVAALQAEMESDQFRYGLLKMNAYSFEYSNTGKVVRSSVYDRANFNSENYLLPLHDLIQSFSEETGFRAFYSAHRPIYDEQIAFYENGFNVQEALRWLERNFPKVEPYDSVKIIFSPLVGYNQSMTSFVSNGFTELQPHVNFPYPSTRPSTLSLRSRSLARGNILFTELNHGFINPAAVPYYDDIAAALGDRAFWITPGSSADSYSGATRVFLEMMNWGLISLYYTDLADPAEQDEMISRVDSIMTDGRGFRQFRAFNRFLVDLYRNRPEGTTIADLYPQIIAWCADQNSQKD